MGLGILASLTPDHWDIEILDESFEEFTYRDADLVGFTALTSQATRAYEIATIYREKNIKTVMGGIHASMMTDEALQYVQAPGLPPLEDLMLFLDSKKMPLYIGVSCAIGRGLVDLHHKPIVNFTYGELASPPELAQLMMDADDVVSF